MKSVLGGIFRQGCSTNSDVIDLIDKLVEKNLKKGGYLITLDNGIGFFHKLKHLWSKKYGDFLTTQSK